jgi:hypothetical protein
MGLRPKFRNAEVVKLILMSGFNMQNSPYFMSRHWTTDKRDTCRMNCNPKYELAAIESVSECSEKGEEVRLPECFFLVCAPRGYMPRVVEQRPVS